MLLGVPKEIKDNEYRVGLVPSTVRELTEKGHQVLVEGGAGAGAGLPDADYRGAGAEIVTFEDSPHDLFRHEPTRFPLLVVALAAGAEAAGS